MAHKAPGTCWLWLSAPQCPSPPFTAPYSAALRPSCHRVCCSSSKACPVIPPLPLPSHPCLISTHPSMLSSQPPAQHNPAPLAWARTGVERTPARLLLGAVSRGSTLPMTGAATCDQQQCEACITALLTQVAVPSLLYVP